MDADSHVGIYRVEFEQAPVDRVRIEHQDAGRVGAE